MADVDREVETVLKRFGIPCLKQEQRTILNCLIQNRDCVAVLPTGFGKSLVIVFVSEEGFGRRLKLWEGYSLLSIRFTYARSSEQAYFPWVGHSSFQRFV